MKAEGNLRKMKSELTIPVRYSLELHDILEPEQTISMNNLLGKDIRVKWMGYMNSIISGKKLNKVFGEGLSYQEFMESPLAVPSIMRPELSRIHEGVALRDYEWEKKHHLTPHTIYLSNLFKLIQINGITSTYDIHYILGISQCKLISERCKTIDQVFRCDLSFSCLVEKFKSLVGAFDRIHCGGLIQHVHE